MVKNVTFRNRDIDMAGNLYLPENFDEKKTYPAVIVCHPGGGVKEQTAGMYAGKISEAGFVTLAFDASYQGESGGQPRGLENPYARVQDISAGIDYLDSLPYVDNKKIGALGICAGGGYTMCATQYDKRIKAAAMVSGADAGSLNRGGFGSQMNTQAVLDTLQAVAENREQEAETGELKIVPIIPETPELFDENTPAMVREAYDYYCTPRAQHPRANNRMVFDSNMMILSFDGFNHIDTLLTQPILAIAGSIADTKFESDYLIKHAASKDKEEFVIEGASHVDLYDKPQYVPQVVKKLREFYTKHLEK